MSAPVDYKSHELNLYSNNNVGRLKFEDGKGTGKGVGFGQNQEYIFAKYTDSATGTLQWPVCIPELHTIDNSTGYVMGVGWYITDTRSKLTDEEKSRSDADSKLSSDLASESKSRADADSKLSSDLASEEKSRQDGDAFLQAQVGGLWGGLQTIESESKARDTALDVKLGVENTRAIGAESALDVKISNEIMDRKSAIETLNNRVDFIVQNTDPVAIDSLTEIINNFSNSGANYDSRITYLESVVASLVNKNI
jgi:hypothetical protein